MKLLIFLAWLPVLACAQTSPAAKSPIAGKPVITSVTPMPMGWKVAFTGVPGALNYAIVDPNQHWFSTQAGSAHVTLNSPAFIQGYSGSGAPQSASFQIAAQMPGGWTALSSSSANTRISGKLPEFTDPYWIYHDGTYFWSGDFSQPGGDPSAILPQFGGSGNTPSSNDIVIDWFHAGDQDFPAGAVRIVNAVTGNFSPAIPSATIDLGAHPYAFWVATVKPLYANADWNLKFESMNDEVVTNILPSLKQYVTAPTPGTFTQNAVNTLNVPMSVLALHANKTDGKHSIYKIVWEQNASTAGTWLVGEMGFANKAR